MTWGHHGKMFRDRFIDVDFWTSTIHDAQSQCGSNAVTGTKPRYLRNRKGTSGGPEDAPFIQSRVSPSTVTAQTPRRSLGLPEGCSWLADKIVNDPGIELGLTVRVRVGLGEAVQLRGG